MASSGLGMLSLDNGESDGTGKMTWIQGLYRGLQAFDGCA